MKNQYIQRMFLYMDNMPMLNLLAFFFTIFREMLYNVVVCKNYQHHHFPENVLNKKIKKKSFNIGSISICK